MISNNIFKIGWIPASWPAPSHIHAGTTTRTGGISPAPYDTLNLADHVGDKPACVTHNRTLLCTSLGLTVVPSWLQQEHGNRIINLADTHATLRGDGAYTTRKNQICAVLTADCLPLLLCDIQGTQIAAVHIGWRGYSRNIIAKAISRFTCRKPDLLAWIGPSISASNYEVGAEVRIACLQVTGDPDVGFLPTRKNYWHADLAGLVRYQLQACGVSNINGVNHCTLTDVERFYSHRRDGVTGRMASLIWMD